jgi:hypothetical protein
MTRKELTFKDAQAEAKKLAADESREYHVFKFPTGFAYCPAQAKPDGWDSRCRAISYGAESE